ncbi:MAG TPA: hypothetical protein VFQ41_19075 [Candidatus Angelobacter sp.]|nr:hypothetical protein [Candidatus Angelobacter sp.]
MKTSSSTNSIWQLLHTLARTRFAPDESRAAVISSAGNRRLPLKSILCEKVSFLSMDFRQRCNLVDGFVMRHPQNQNARVLLCGMHSRALQLALVRLMLGSFHFGNVPDISTPQTSIAGIECPELDSYQQNDRWLLRIITMEHFKREFVFVRKTRNSLHHRMIQM